MSSKTLPGAGFFISPNISNRLYSRRQNYTIILGRVSSIFRRTVGCAEMRIILTCVHVGNCESLSFQIVNANHSHSTAKCESFSFAPRKRNENHSQLRTWPKTHPFRAAPVLNLGKCKILAVPRTSSQVQKL